MHREDVLSLIRRYKFFLVFLFSLLILEPSPVCVSLSVLVVSEGLLHEM